MLRLHLSLRWRYHTAVLAGSTSVSRRVATARCCYWLVIPGIVRRLGRVVCWHRCSGWHRSTSTTSVRTGTTHWARVWHRPSGRRWTAAGKFTVGHTSTSCHSALCTRSLHDCLTRILLDTDACNMNIKQANTEQAKRTRPVWALIIQQWLPVERCVIWQKF